MTEPTILDHTWDDLANVCYKTGDTVHTMAQMPEAYVAGYETGVAAMLLSLKERDRKLDEAKWTPWHIARRAAESLKNTAKILDPQMATLVMATAAGYEELADTLERNFKYA